MSMPPVLRQSAAPSTIIQWTMCLEDAALIHETLLEAAETATRSADYLQSPAYLEAQRTKSPDGQGELSSTDLERITTLRSKALRLHRLVES